MDQSFRLMEISYVCIHLQAMAHKLELGFLIKVLFRFSRGPVQTVLHPNKRQRTGRLCGSFEDEIEKLHAEASDEQRIANDLKKNKREAEVKLEELDKYMSSIKRQCVNASKSFTSKKLALEEEMHLHSAENNATPLSSVDELVEEISEIQKKIEEEQVLLDGLQKNGLEAAGKADDLKLEFDKLCESANGEIAALEKAESELVEIEKEMGSANKAKDHYEGVMKNKVLIDIEEAEDHYQELTKKRKESVEKASIICSQNELDSLGGCDGNTPEQISAQLGRLNQTLMRESQRYSESIDDLRMLYKKKERGERSFSTLCFALALHEMTEAPFRAMDEFDVFMDAVSRKISLDTLVDFAEAHGSQWIFITPHDTSMVRAGDRIKKMQMAAPRS
ncbi:hypothetical protein LR48_Vigan08g210300 [Vigna angularis]|uniref:RecF/RecN/SMC N-terminal domain-containing protein n=1 Tax=Phaseolus angularis TaxID=3914 RepID=A0A0L9V884_PHAAN|nr:hypothetical protein LR48_Vigan08g210300 [Vigna angularis]